MKRYDKKLTNPKDHIGSGKLHLDLVPDSMVAVAALGFLEGALKYGKYNWRVAGVRLSIYMAALERHRMKFMSGEWCDPKTKVPHLSSMLACLGIVVDALMSGKLNDDRPPAQPELSQWIDMQTDHIADLKTMFIDCNPHQHTINDDTRRTSEGADRRSAKAARRVLSKARTKRNGRTRA